MAARPVAATVTMLGGCHRVGSIAPVRRRERQLLDLLRPGGLARADNPIAPVRLEPRDRADGDPVWWSSDGTHLTLAPIDDLGRTAFRERRILRRPLCLTEFIDPAYQVVDIRPEPASAIPIDLQVRRRCRGRTCDPRRTGPNRHVKCGDPSVDALKRFSLAVRAD